MKVLSVSITVFFSILLAWPAHAEPPFVSVTTQSAEEGRRSLRVSVHRGYRLNTAAPRSARIYLELSGSQRRIDGEKFKLKEASASLSFVSKVAPAAVLFVLICRADRCRREVLNISF